MAAAPWPQPHVLAPHAGVGLATPCTGRECAQLNATLGMSCRTQSTAIVVSPRAVLACRQDEAGGQSDSAYTLLEAAVLACSSVAGQRAAALRLLAGALEQARRL